LYPDTDEVLGVQLSAAECAPGAADTPVPVRLTFAGDPVALLTTEMLPVALPAAVGANCTPTVTLCVGDSVTALPPLDTLNPPPLLVIDDIATLPLPVFVTLKSCTAEVLPTFSFPKLKLVGLSDNVKLDVVPLPLTGTTRGESVALLTIVRPPLEFPAVVGANFTVKFDVADAASVMGRDIPLRVNPDPVSVPCEIVRLALPVFLSCTACEFVVPVVTLPKLIVDGVTLNCDVVGGGGFVVVSFATTPAQPYRNATCAAIAAIAAREWMRTRMFLGLVCFKLLFSFVFTRIVAASHLSAWMPE
jgi:hypothetical protein